MDKYLGLFTEFERIPTSDYGAPFPCIRGELAALASSGRPFARTLHVDSTRQTELPPALMIRPMNTRHTPVQRD